MLGIRIQSQYSIYCMISVILHEKTIMMENRLMVARGEGWRKDTTAKVQKAGVLETVDVFCILIA